MSCKRTTGRQWTPRRSRTEIVKLRRRSQSATTRNTTESIMTVESDDLNRLPFGKRSISASKSRENKHRAPALDRWISRFPYLFRFGQKIVPQNEPIPGFALRYVSATISIGESQLPNDKAGMQGATPVWLMHRIQNKVLKRSARRDRRLNQRTLSFGISYFRSPIVTLGRRSGKIRYSL